MQNESVLSPLAFQATSREVSLDQKKFLVKATSYQEFEGKQSFPFINNKNTML